MARPDTAFSITRTSKRTPYEYSLHHLGPDPTPGPHAAGRHADPHRRHRHLQPANGPAIRAAVIFNAPIDGMTTYTTEVLPAGAAHARPAHPLPPRARASHRVRPPRGLSPRKHRRPRRRFRVIQSQQLFSRGSDHAEQPPSRPDLGPPHPTVPLGAGRLYRGRVRHRQARRTLLDWHIRFGCATLGLLLFRLIWGFIGPRYARFSQFLRGPAAARYLKGRRAAGHNPLGRCRCWRCCWCWASRRSAACSPPTTSWCRAAVRPRRRSHCRRNDVLAQAQRMGHHRTGRAAPAGRGLVCAGAPRLVRAIITGKADARDVPPGTPPADNGAAVWLRALLLAAMVTGLVLWIRSLEIAADMSFS